MTNINPKIVLGIETSCDETSAAIVHENKTILTNIVYSQINDHQLFGGVVPEIAARAHVSLLDTLLKKALETANIPSSTISAVAATAGPGLIGGLIVGLVTGKALASAWNVPFIGVNHLQGHALTPRLTDNVEFPYLLLLASGGHTQILLVHHTDKYTRLSTTLDDAIGEVFDKTAKILDLGYPGGPKVEQIARTGDPSRFSLPRPMLHSPSLNFSFSGLKTAVRRHLERMDSPITSQDKADLCAGLQHAIIEIIEKKLSKAYQSACGLTERPLTALVASGGVATNKVLRQSLTRLATQMNLPFIAPPPQLCTDNAAMIAWAGIERLHLNMTDPFTIPARARWPLDPHAAPAPGAGVKA